MIYLKTIFCSSPEGVRLPCWRNADVQYVSGWNMGKSGSCLSQRAGASRRSFLLLWNPEIYTAALLPESQLFMKTGSWIISGKSNRNRKLRTAFPDPTATASAGQMRFRREQVTFRFCSGRDCFFPEGITVRQESGREAPRSFLSSVGVFPSRWRKVLVR